MTNAPASSEFNAPGETNPSPQGPAAVTLADLASLRTAPALAAHQRPGLRAELQSRLAACDWFTVGVMAPSAASALAALRSCEQSLGWSALVAHGQNPAPETVEGPVFLKGNQHTGQFLLRAEAGLGEGILISGHLAGEPDPAREGTWGPLPLDLFES
jgi:hypothetical protein